MRLLSWNVNGIRAAERKGFVDWFSEIAPDVLNLQETKAHKEQLSDQLTSVEDITLISVLQKEKGIAV